MISKKLILELQKVFKEDYNEELSFEEATEAAHNLVGFLKCFSELMKEFKMRARHQNDAK